MESTFNIQHHKTGFRSRKKQLLRARVGYLSFLAEPIFRTAVHHTVLKTEAEVVHRLAQHRWRGTLGIEVGITAGEGRQNLCGSPPTALAVLETYPSSSFSLLTLLRETGMASWL